MPAGPGCPPARPIAREVELRTRIDADELPHLPTAPGARASAVSAAVRALRRPGEHCRRRISVAPSRIVICSPRCRVTVRNPMAPRFMVNVIAVGDVAPVGVLARVSALRKCHRDRERGRQRRQLHPDTPSFLTRVLSLSADKKLAQTVRFERVSADENASLDGEARGRHSIPRRFPDALIRMARICSAGKRRQIVAAICRPKIH